MADIKAVFETLYHIDVNKHTSQNQGLTYLSWAWAWAEVKEKFPDATYEIEKFENSLPYVFDPNTGYMVWTKVTIQGITHEMWLPVMDSKNKAMKNEPYEYQTKAGKKWVQAATMTDINKAIMRALTKNLAMHGLGLYIYAGEDVPTEEIKYLIPAEAKSINDTLDEIAKLTDSPIESWARLALNAIGLTDTETIETAPAGSYQSIMKAAHALHASAERKLAKKADEPEAEAVFPEVEEA